MGGGTTTLPIRFDQLLQDPTQRGPEPPLGRAQELPLELRPGIAPAFAAAPVPDALEIDATRLCPRHRDSLVQAASIVPEDEACEAIAAGIRRVEDVQQKRCLPKCLPRSQYVSAN
jgi:hypothetical protein